MNGIWTRNYKVQQSSSSRPLDRAATDFYLEGISIGI
jgi:hypothetical protein